MATQDKHDQDQQDFAAAFNEDTPKSAGPSEDEEFGLAGASGADQGAGADAAPEGNADAAAAGAPADAAAASPADASADKEKALQDREAALTAREKELDARAASIQTTNTNEVQTGMTDKGAGDGKGEGEGGEDEPTDARAALAEDFGPEFVSLMERFIRDVVKGSVSEHLSPVQALVQSVIDDLRTERDVAHFKTIAAAHEDFMEIVESPEFKDWQGSLPEQEQADMTRIADNGSAQEIIHMLTKFKQSKTSAEPADDSALDNAEGVRSGGLRLPAEPKQSQDYAAAWNEA